MSGEVGKIFVFFYDKELTYEIAIHGMRYVLKSKGAQMERDRHCMTSHGGILPTCIPHPLQKALRMHQVRLWQLAALPGMPSEGSLSKMLRGITSMPRNVEDTIASIVSQMNEAA